MTDRTSDAIPWTTDWPEARERARSDGRPVLAFLWAPG